MENYIYFNGTKIELTEEQIDEIKKSLGISQTKLSNISAGDAFKIGKYEFVVLEQSSDTTAVILKSLLHEDEKFGSNNNFVDSCVDELCEDFANEISELVGNKNLIVHTLDLTSDDGLKDYGSVKRRVSLLTCNQYRKYVEILDEHKIDKWWWLATAYSTPTHGYSAAVKCVTPSGNIGDGGCCSRRGVRPFCILKSNIFVSK